MLQAFQYKKKSKILLKIGVIGLGYWGPNYARVFNAISNCLLTALCDSDLNRLGKIRYSYPNVTCFDNYEQMIAQADMDALIVAVPLNQHYNIAKSALLAGKHVLVEKPMAASSMECSDLIGIAEKSGLTLMVGHIFLHAAPVQMINKMIRSGYLGDICCVNCRRLNLGVFRNDHNVVWDLATHDISILINMFNGNPDSVNCQGKSNLKNGIEDVSNVSMLFAGGQFASMQLD